ncbi:hypothetical protein [Streptomyces sp. NPDC021020]|uniref:hypothetical protein n=1 Tax=Streptomyces sp. NPDC021020 TaxID=3365109 RepID=UPI00379A889D
MPDYYDSIGQAIGAALAHNIKLAHRQPPRVVPPVTSVEAPHTTPPHGLGEQKLDAQSPANRTEPFGTDVEIFRWQDSTVWADVRHSLPDTSRDLVHSVLRLEGFERISPDVLPHSYKLVTVPTEGELRRRLSAVAENLSRSGFTVNIEPDLYTDEVLPSPVTEARRRQAALRSSPTAGTTPTPAAPSPPLAPPTGPTTLRRTR